MVTGFDILFLSKYDKNIQMTNGMSVMKLISFRHIAQDQVTERFGLIEEPSEQATQVVDLYAAFEGRYANLKDFIEFGQHEDLNAVSQAAPRIELSEIQFSTLIGQPQQIFCIGLNYLEHVEETKNEVKPYPPVFIRLPASQCAHLAPIAKPEISDRFDYEGELAVVIGKQGKNIPAAQAEDYIFGYSCYNDVSVRDWQHHTGQWAPGKNFEGTGSFGPWLVTKDEIGIKDDLELKTILNGQVVQHASTKMLINDIPSLIAYISTFTPLFPGDVIVTGTPGGVGARRQPPLFMKAGDVVEVYIEKIGTLSNPII